MHCCTDKTGENGTLICAPGEISCQNSFGPICVDLSLQCDDVQDCVDGADETPNCSIACEQVEGG